MAVIDKKLIHFTNLATFEQRLSAGDIKDTSIVFIQDAKRIWTHNQYYSSPYTKEEIDQLFVGSNVTLDDYDKNGVAGIVATDTVNSAFGKVEDYLGSLSDLNAVLVDTDDIIDDPAINDYISSEQLNTTLSNYATKIELNDKQDIISDLNTIRSNAEQAIKEIPEDYVKTEDLSDINAFISYRTGNNIVTSVTSVTVDKQLVIANISSSQSFSLASLLDAGKEMHIIIHNTGSSSISIALPNTNSYICLVDTALSIDAGNYAEINIISDGTKMYIRAI